MGAELVSAGIELVEAGACSSLCGSSYKPGLAPAGEALFFASPKKSTQKKGDPMVRVPYAALRGNLRCSAKAGSGTNSPAAQTSACPDPLLPALFGPARRGLRRKTKPIPKADSGSKDAQSATLRSPLPFSPTPSVGAEERRARRIRADTCLSVASLCQTPAGPSTAGCPGAKRRGRRQRGRLFFGDFLLAKQKKVTCRRATPGQLASCDTSKNQVAGKWSPDQAGDDRPEKNLLLIQ